MKDLMALPGIGAYTAGAIASIAFGKVVPAVDGNVLRIIARITASREDIGSPKVKKDFEQQVLQLLPMDNPGDFNQALMDLGATICLPNGEPTCKECPVNDCCEAYRRGLTAEIPVKTDKKARRIEKKTVFVIAYKDKFALRKRDDKGLLPNLWEFPNIEGHLTGEQCRQVLERWGITVYTLTALTPAKHIFTHLEWHMQGFLVSVLELKSLPDLVWVTKEEINRQYSIPTAFKKVVADVKEIVL
jgi:A/G-specific adenine glycosylase